LGPAQAEQLIAAAAENRFNQQASGRMQDLIYLRALLALQRNDSGAALATLKRSLDTQVRTSAALRYAALLGSKGYPIEGLSLLNHYEQIKEREMKPGWGMPRMHSWVLSRQDYWSHELAHLRTTLIEDAEQQKRTAAGPQQ
jgi:hypothetical protein